MITFRCPACQKRLSVKDELGGKRRRCPGCGGALTIPARLGVASAAEGTRDLPPSPGEDLPGRGLRTQPTPPGPSGPPTPPPAGDLDATQGHDRPDASRDPALTAFLFPPQADDELGRLGNYRILKVLGHGGMGVVFLAEDPRLNRAVAIKAMLPALAASANSGQRFLREGQAMAAVKHDHVVTIHQVDEERGVPFLVMEFLAGETLDERLKRDGKLPVGEALRVGREVAEGLAAAHAKGLIHRDVKPANVWLEAPRGRVKLLDFGLARAASQDAGLTQQGAVVGTPAYMAPEQGRGETVDARADLFSLGVVMYRMLTGRQPFEGGDAISTLMAVASYRPPPPARLDVGVPRELSDLVMKLLEKDAARRPASAGEVAEVLHDLAGKLAREGAKSAAAPAKPDRRRRVLLAVAAVLLGVLAGVAALAVIRIQGEQGDYVIETDDPDFSFRVGKGAVTLEDRKTSRKYDLKVVREDKAKGEHELEVTDADAGLSFKAKTFTVKRGERVALKAWFERKREAAAEGRPGGAEDAWLKRVTALPAEKQVEAVAAKLKELNPGFDGKVSHKVEGGVVTELSFVTDKVIDISPLRALSGLRSLAFGSISGKAQLSDLSPLKGMKLTEFTCDHQQVSDLSPLAGMPLTGLNCEYTNVSDLRPLKGMPLTSLNLGYTKVSDLTPLRGMKLHGLILWHSPVADLSPLEGMRLAGLVLNGTKVSDLSPLKGMQLKALLCNGTEVADLSPLKGMPLVDLQCGGTRVADLSPLKGMPLKEINCDFKPERDAEILRSIKTLETINERPAKEFWMEVDAKRR